MPDIAAFNSKPGLFAARFIFFIEGIVETCATNSITAYMNFKFDRWIEYPHNCKAYAASQKLYQNCFHYFLQDLVMYRKEISVYLLRHLHAKHFENKKVEDDKVSRVVSLVFSLLRRK